MCTGEEECETFPGSGIGGTGGGGVPEVDGESIVESLGDAIDSTEEFFEDLVEDDDADGGEGGSATSSDAVRKAGSSDKFHPIEFDENGQAKSSDDRDATSSGDGAGASKVTFKATQGSNTDLIRTAEVDGRDYRIKSGHGYNRPHSTGDVELATGATMDEVETAILSDLDGYVSEGGVVPKPESGVLERTVTVNGQEIGYRAVTNPTTGIPEVGTYFPITSE